MINLCVIYAGEKYHYTEINDLNRILFNQSTHKEHKYFCKLCLHKFTQEELLERHIPDFCGVNIACWSLRCPNESNPESHFENYHKQL